MEQKTFKLLTEKQKDIILALHKSELTSRQIAEVAQCAQSTVIRHLQKFQETGQLPMTERRKATRYRGTSSQKSPGRTTLSVNYAYGDRNYGGISEIIKKPINEPLNYYQKPIVRLSYTNMMEVKHSPSSQMDFRTTTNGLPNEEEDEEMDTLLDGGAVKSMTTSNLECGSTPILNGNIKYPALEDGMEIDLLDDDMDEELNTTVSDTETKKINEDTEEKTEDLDLYDLELEQAVVTEKKMTNGETTDSSSVRDTGDDLDTLLSKINDLVEDCMEPSASVDSPTKVNTEIVDLIDDESEDVIDNKTKEPQEDISDETQVEELEEIVESAETVVTEVEIENYVEISSEVKEEEKVELATEEDTSYEVSELKLTVDLSEDVSEENGHEVTETELEIAEKESTEVVEEQIPEVGAEEISDVVLGEAIDEEIPAAITVEEATTEVVNETEEAVVEEVAQELEKVLEEITTENMDIDDDIVCLDSPMPDEKEEEKNVDDAECDKKTPETSLQDSEPSSQEQKEKQIKVESKQIPAETKVFDAVSSKTVIPDENVKKDENVPSKATEDDDEIFLIEDDDEPIKETESDAKLDAKNEESANSSIKQDKLPEKEIKEDSKPANEEEEEKEKKTEVVSEEKPSETKEEDDDDIVCLDDSFEETEEPKEEKKSEEKSNENISQTVAEKDAVDLPTTGLKEVDSEEQVKPKIEVVEELTVKEGVEETKEVGAANVEEIVEKKEKATDEKMDEADISAEKSTKIGESVEEQEIKSAEKSDKNVECLEQVIKPTEEVLKEASSKTTDTETSGPKEIPQATPAPETSSKILNDNDIINLDDDDEEEVAPSTEKKDEKTAEEVPASKSLALLSDNSDNARDGVEEKDDKNEPKVSAEKLTPMPSESNSNSSSNLLKESTVTERDESRSEPCEQPPAKRIRLSQDEASSRNSNGSQEDTSSKPPEDDDVMEIIDNDDEANKTLKRVHSNESISSDFKKPKTDLDTSKVEDEKPPELLEEIIPAKIEPIKEETKVEKKPVDVKPLPLYPPPNFDAPKIGLSLDFLRRFKKSIHKMNKSDLEELVLQKIVEAIVHKSEFSEMRELIEKQEKIISGHRSKITELNKQFRDLEMVHNRVLKDLETKNSQFIMPVKITRAVGLQVFFPNKKYDQPIAPLPAPNSVQAPSPSSMSRSVSTSSSTSSIPDKAPTSIPATINNLAPQASAPTPTGGISNQQRRGCVQKLTPMRPDGPRTALLNRGATAGVVSSSTPSPMTPKDTPPKILNRQLTPKARLPQTPLGLNASNSSLPQQAHNVHPLTSPSEPERPKLPSMPPGIATKKTGGTLKSFPPSKRIPKSWQSDPPAPVQSSPTTAPTASLPMVPPQSSMSNSSLAVKTPNKSVIDLTDEDDVAPTPSPKAPNVVAAATKPVNAGTHRVGPYKVSVIPAAQLQQQPRPNLPKPTAARPQNNPQLVSKPNGTAQNAVRRTPPPNNQRYRHPAPLPNQPIHSSNPLWKLPPARPTIRISNLDSGIVISWTIEDMAKEKYAESTSYQIYAYQETSGPPLVESWRHVGDVKAMLLPMAVTLTQFQEGQRYYFAVRAVDAHNRCGPFSFAKTWS